MGGGRAVHSRNPFFSRPHSLGIFLGLRDPSVVASRSGQPSVQRGFGSEGPLGSPLSPGPSAELSDKDPFLDLESHPASKGQEDVCLRSLFVWGPGSTRGPEPAPPSAVAPVWPAPSGSQGWLCPDRSGLPAAPPRPPHGQLGRALGPGHCRLPPPSPSDRGPGRASPAASAQEGLRPGTHSPGGQAGVRGQANSASLFRLVPMPPRTVA